MTGRKKAMAEFSFITWTRNWRNEHVCQSMKRALLLTNHIQWDYIATCLSATVINDFHSQQRRLLTTWRCRMMDLNIRNGCCLTRHSASSGATAWAKRTLISTPIEVWADSDRHGNELINEIKQSTNKIRENKTEDAKWLRKKGSSTKNNQWIKKSHATFIVINI